jgi:hypothetical protein
LKREDYKEGRLRKADWLIAEVPIAKARRFIVANHYAQGASNTRAAIHGLYRKSDYSLMGVAWWIPPTRDAVAALWPQPEAVLSLSRLAIAPGVPKNAATFLLMASVKRLDPRWVCLVTYADTAQGHTGGIYRAAGWEYTGLTKPERLYVKDGVMVSRKCGPKTRTHAEMLALGAECKGSFEKHRFRLVRSVRHRKRGNTQRSLIAA